MEKIPPGGLLPTETFCEVGPLRVTSDESGSLLEQDYKDVLGRVIKYLDRHAELVYSHTFRPEGNSSPGTRIDVYQSNGSTIVLRAEKNEISKGGGLSVILAPYNDISLDLARGIKRRHRKLTLDDKTK